MTSSVSRSAFGTCQHVELSALNVHLEQIGTACAGFAHEAVDRERTHGSRHAVDTRACFDFTVQGGADEVRMHVDREVSFEGGRSRNRELDGWQRLLHLLEQRSIFLERLNEQIAGIRKHGLTETRERSIGCSDIDDGARYGSDRAGLLERVEYRLSVKDEPLPGAIGGSRIRPARTSVGCRF